MTIHMELSLIKYVNSRKTQYTMTEVMRALKRVNADPKIIPPAVMIITVKEDFEDEGLAIYRRRILTEALQRVHRNVAFRFDITRS